MRSPHGRMERSLFLERRSVDEPYDDAFANAPTECNIAPIQGACPPNTILALVVSSNMPNYSNHLLSVIFRCDSHKFCSASMRVRTTPESTFEQ